MTSIKISKRVISVSENCSSFSVPLRSNIQNFKKILLFLQYENYGNFEKEAVHDILRFARDLSVTLAFENMMFYISKSNENWYGGIFYNGEFISDNYFL